MNINHLMFPAALFLGGMAMAQSDILVDFNFADGNWPYNNVQAVKDAGFTLNADADSNSNCFVSLSSQALILSDTTAGVPTATYALSQTVTSGSASFVANIGGRANMVGIIQFVDANGDVLFGVQLHNATALYVNALGQSGSSGTNYYETAVGSSGTDLTDFLSYSFDWSSNSDGTGGSVHITANGNELGTGFTYATTGVVASVVFKSGYGSATSNRYLRIQTMQVESSAIPEQSTVSLWLGVSLLGLLGARRLRGR